MIDSVTLRLEDKYYCLLDKNQFTVNKWNYGKGYKNFKSFAEDVRKKKRAEGIYFPLITINNTTRGKDKQSKYLSIQISLPKSVHGTNLFDIGEEDLSIIYSNIYIYLQELGIGFKKEDLTKATLSKVDFSKIIKLPGYLGEANNVVRKINGFNYKASSKYRQTQYNDAGNGVSNKFLNSTQGYSVYDKFGEILSKGYTKQEKEIIKGFKENKFRRNALRFEFSLNRQDSLNSFLRRRIEGKENNFTLEDVLKYDLCKGVMNDIFDEVFGGINLGLISLSEMEENRLIEYLSKADISQSQKEKLFYWVRFAYKFGLSGTWDKIALEYNGGTISRRKKEIAQVLEELGKIDGMTPNLIGYLKEQHQEFKLIKPKSK